MDQLERKFFSQQNINSLYCNIRERNPSISLKILISGMITAFELEIGYYTRVPYNEVYMSKINSSACYYIQCEFSRSLRNINN